MLHVNTSHYVATSSGRSTTGIHLDGTHGNAGEYGGGISFACGGDGSAAIAARQMTSSQHVLGLSFFTHDSSTSSDNAVEKVRIYDGGATAFNNGIILGNGLTYNANNLLDEYEEGTFTPQLNGMGSVSYDLRAGRYTKIGNVCYFQIRINLGSRSGGSHAHITNMPFTQDQSTIQYPHCTFFAIEDVDLGGDRHPVAQFQSSEIYLYSVGYESSANYSAIDENQIKDSSQWGVFGFYYAT